MAFNDPIAELLTRIRNAIMARHRYVDINISKMRVSLVEILREQGFIDNYLTSEEKKKIRIFLKYTKNKQPVIKGLKRVSSPGLRRYIGCSDIPRVLGGIGIAILSTSLGVIEGESARHKKVGGELLCYIW
jgi:small subunit ribosomal protein S8